MRVEKSVLLIGFHIPISQHDFTKHIMFPAWMGKPFSALAEFVINWGYKVKTRPFNKLLLGV